MRKLIGCSPSLVFSRQKSRDMDSRDFSTGRQAWPDGRSPQAVSRAGEAMTTVTMPAPAGFRRVPRLRLEHVIMAGAVVALVILVVLPLLFLLVGSVRGERGVSFEHFSEVLSGRLYTSALWNSLILGAWTGLFSLVIGLLLAWAVSRTDVAHQHVDQPGVGAEQVHEGDRGEERRRQVGQRRRSSPRSPSCTCSAPTPG